MVYRIGVIGLGIMGNRMLDRLAQHPDLEAAAGWDPSADARERTKKAHPTLAPDASAEALCRRADLDCIYIASPPASHIAHAFAAFDAGKPVFVEKPLATDLKEAEAIVARATREKRAAAINFSLAHAPGLIVLEDTIRSGRFGKPVAASVEVEFAAWPRPWQMGAAPWLSRRAEGGFTREVISHFVFALQRTLGSPEIVETRPTYPAGDGAETALDARVIFGNVHAAISGRVGSTTVADRNVTTVEFEQGGVRLVDWMSVEIREGDKWRPPGDGAEELRRRAQVGQLDALAAMLAGRAHRLPTLAEGLTVQRCVEGLLKG
ncbi:MAG: Gfo/Idh/MocA family oxidoreductase [Alphaproteobacteria bacterium]|nr:Gfo/Idh/MocA family oxidoreductase [Alphaproteobacteria bacterium]